MSSKERSGLRRFAFNKVGADLNKVVTESGNSIFVDTVSGCPEGNFG